FDNCTSKTTRQRCFFDGDYRLPCSEKLVEHCSVQRFDESCIHHFYLDAFIRKLISCFQSQCNRWSERQNRAISAFPQYFPCTDRNRFQFFVHYDANTVSSWISHRDWPIVVLDRGLYHMLPFIFIF